VRGTDDREVAAIERRHLLLAETLAAGDHRGIDEAEIEVGVAALELDGAQQVVLVRVHDSVAAPYRSGRPRHDVLDQDGVGIGAVARPELGAVLSRRSAAKNSFPPTFVSKVGVLFGVPGGCP
jgi:hypothetical protein